MGIQILSDPQNGAVFFSSGTEWAFGPVMPDADVAEAFLRFLNPADPRLLEDNELERRWSKFLQQRLTCPMEHTNAGVANFGGGVTHFYCREKNCDAVWDLEGNAVSEDEDDE